MAYELILSTNTLNEGRIKINNFFNNSGGLISAGTATNSILTSGGYNTNNGNYSFVTGKRNTIGSGSYNSILGGSGHTFGGFNFSTIVGGFKNKVYNGFGTVVNGNGNNVGGIYSTILNGRSNATGGNYCTHLGGKTSYTSSEPGMCFMTLMGGKSNGMYLGYYSAVVWGANNYSRANISFIGGGRNNSMQGYLGAILGGSGNRVDHTGSVVLGTGGRTRGNNSFIFANGGTTTTPAVTNNRFRIDSTGAATMNGALTQNGTADYAEYFEWEDQNPINEDRTGFFVSINKDKIKIDNSNVIGVVSATPSVIGDGAEEFWNQLHKRDIWGREIYEHYSAYTISNAKELKNNKLYFLGLDNKIYSEHPTASNINGILADNISLNDLDFSKLTDVIKINKFNENYDPNQKYKPRSERKEWAPIGLLGKLYVRTSEKITSTKIDVGSDGRAINGTKYHVLKTTKEFDGDFGIVQILFR